MRILFVAHSFPRYAADMAGNFLLNLALGQIKLGHQVAVVAPHHPGSLLYEVIDGVEVFRYRYGQDKKETLAYHGNMRESVRGSWAGKWRFLRFIFAMRQKVRRTASSWRPDVIHVHWWFPGGFALLPSPPAPSVLTSHGTDMYLLDKATILRPLARLILQKFAQGTAVSSPLATRMARYGMLSKNISVIPMPLPYDLSVPPPYSGQPKHLLYVGRLVELKGVEYLLRALPSVLKRHPTATLQIIGDGPLRAELETLSAQLGLTDSVIFRGYLPAAETTASYRSSGVLIVPSITDSHGCEEGLGMVSLEAMYHSLPVVASNSGGIPDIVHDGVSGVLVPPKDPEALAEAINVLLDDPKSARKLGNSGHHWLVNNLTPEVISARFEHVYQLAASSHPTSAISS